MLRAALGRTVARQLVGVRTFSTQSDFENAQKNVLKLPEEPDVDVKLSLYGLFKQATKGDASGSRPGMMDFAGRAKFDAWKANAGVLQEEAQKKYVETVNALLKAAKVDLSGGGGSSASGIKPAASSENIQISQSDNVFKITLNRPDKFNALTWQMYGDMTKMLNTASADRSTALTVISANGPYYCSGNDLKNFAVKSADEMKALADRGEGVLEEFVRAHVTHEKPLIILVNGPAIGISVTVMGLADLVIASDKATFQTPFSSLGQSPEGCSSYTFPLLMGTSKASEVLLFGKKLTAEEALERNLIAKIVPHDQFEKETGRLIAEYSKLPPESLRLNKQLVRNVHKKRLLQANLEECAFLKKRWLSEECHRALANFMNRKK